MRGLLGRAKARIAGLGRLSSEVCTPRMAALAALIVLGLIAWPRRLLATHAAEQGSATSCAEVQSIRFSEDPEYYVLHDRAPETAELAIVSARPGPRGAVTVIAVGPVLGSMDTKNVETTRTCNAAGVTITATTTRSAGYYGAVLKNTLWRPRLEIVLVPRQGGTLLTTTWKMRLSTGAEVRHTRMPPYPDMYYPISVTTRTNEKTRPVQQIDHVAYGKAEGGVTVTSVHEITNYQGPGKPRVVDTMHPTISIRATPSILWPPNGSLMTVTVSGSIRDEAGGSGINPNTTDFFVVDQYHEVQPTGSVTMTSDGSFSFPVRLKASRDGNDPNGRRYSINVNASDNAGNSVSATAIVTVPHEHRN